MLIEISHFLPMTCSGAFSHSWQLLTLASTPSSLVFPPSDINLAGEPKPHRSKTVKRSAGDMYRCVRTDLHSQQQQQIQQRNHFCNSTFRHDLKRKARKSIKSKVNLCSLHSSSLDLDYDFQRDYYDR